MFDLSKVNWELCDERAQNNLVKLVCDLWMSGIQSFDDLSSKLHLGDSTVREYIKNGARLGWCDYDSRKWIEKQCKSIHVINSATSQEYTFASIKDCANGTIDICGHRIAEATIKKYCNNGLPYSGLLFNCIDETIQN